MQTAPSDWLVRRLNWFVLLMYVVCMSLCVGQITRLKIDSNPFAKGFRDSSRLCDFDRLT